MIPSLDCDVVLGGLRVEIVIATALTSFSFFS